MLKLYLVRHGATSANQQGVYYGSLDLPLSESGIAQGKKLAGTLADIEFDQVIVSGLQRTQQTANLIRPQIKFTVQPAFNELNFGDWEGLHHRQLAEQNSPQYQAWCNDWINQAPPNGESFQQFKQRVVNGWQQLTAEQAQGCWLIVGHQGPLRVIMLSLLGLTEKAFWQFTFQQEGYSLITLDNDYAIIEKLNTEK